jgi:N-acetylglucosamine kinase-like BadF-type ATPase
MTTAPFILLMLWVGSNNSDLSWARVADLARYAFQAESDGDAVARRLLHNAATDLAAAVTVSDFFLPKNLI